MTNKNAQPNQVWTLKQVMGLNELAHRSTSWSDAGVMGALDAKLIGMFDLKNWCQEPGVLNLKIQMVSLPKLMLILSTTSTCVGQGTVLLCVLTISSPQVLSLTSLTT